MPRPGLTYQGKLVGDGECRGKGLPWYSPTGGGIERKEHWLGGQTMLVHPSLQTSHSSLRKWGRKDLSPG